MNNRVLKISLAVLLASVGVSVDMDAMESKRITSMKDYADKNGKVIPTAVPQAKEANWFVSPEKLKTRSEMLNFLETHKKDIFYVIMTEGQEVRNAVGVHAGRQVLKAMVKGINKKRAKEAQEVIKAGKEYEKKLVWSTMRADDDEKLKDIGKGGLWDTIGRNRLGYKAKEFEFEPTRPLSKLKTEIELAREGFINCTGWATFINWFLNMNGIPSRLLTFEQHQGVCVPLRDEDDPAIIRLYRIEIDENVDSVDEIKFEIEPLTTGFTECEASPWDFMAWYKPEHTWGWAYTKQNYDFSSSVPFVGAPSKKAYEINPTMAYLQLIQEGIRNTDDKHSLAALNGYVFGLQYEFSNLINEVDSENVRKRYRAVFLPMDRHGILFPLNLDLISKAVEKNSENGKERLFETRYKDQNDLAHLILVRFNLSYDTIEELKRFEDEYFLEMGIPKKINAEEGIGYLDGQMRSSTGNRTINLRATVMGLPKGD